MAESHLGHGITSSFRAPYSGVLLEADIKASVATLPAAVKELKEVWMEIGMARNSGLALSTNGNPFDDTVREGQWQSELQQVMPIAGGAPGSKGIPQEWLYRHREENFGRQPSVVGGSNFEKFGKFETEFDSVETTDVSNELQKNSNHSNTFHSNANAEFSTRLGIAGFARGRVVPDFAWRMESSIGHLTVYPEEWEIVAEERNDTAHKNL